MSQIDSDVNSLRFELSFTKLLVQFNTDNKTLDISTIVMKSVRIRSLVDERVFLSSVKVSLSIDSESSYQLPDQFFCSYQRTAFYFDNMRCLFYFFSSLLQGTAD